MWIENSSPDFFHKTNPKIVSRGLCGRGSRRGRGGSVGVDGPLVGAEVVGVAEPLVAEGTAVSPLHPTLQTHVAGEVRA